MGFGLETLLVLSAINEIDDGGVTSFSIDPVSGALTFLNRVSAHGAAPCHCCVDASDAFFFCASYAGGTPPHTISSFSMEYTRTSSEFPRFPRTLYRKA